jgi:hypothetical protein
MAMTFWHYTCDHGHQEIGGEGRLISAVQLAQKMGKPEAFEHMPAYQRAIAEIIWMTDMEYPDADALGLTRVTLSCDRTAYRYRVAAGYRSIRYVDFRRELPKRTRDELENAPGALPMHWWMAYMSVPVVYDPIAKGGRSR